ncbi:serine hydrolase [Alkalimonas amylolytica]|uniref:CubicO group peptidase, beta-lactamase class C family n=1 Tax=Alkalimonas amylolytica TaxID=152573 RepID=A0A1H4EKB4_ALKAM|nr:serine hydrolase [Alkalimonas amylolytica]SEA85020.1 CubicO group peptidase, beta-lactamase class C family [Alkalimonas amylolytica]
MNVRIWAGICLTVASISVPAITAEASYHDLFSAHFAADEPGAVVLVSRQGETLYRAAIGKADLSLAVALTDDMVFPIGSVSKQFTAVAILQLMEQGKLTLDDTIQQHLPDFPQLSHPITIRQLLSHTSGLENYIARHEWREHWRNDFTLSEMRQHYVHYPLKFAPDQHFDYSNSGYLVLAEIIEHLSGLSYGDYVTERLFAPAGMEQSYQLDNYTVIPGMPRGYIPHGSGYRLADFVSMTHMIGPGSLASTLDDLQRWDQALFSGQLITKESLQQALSSHTLSNGSATGYGLGWEVRSIRGRPSFEHGGYMYGYFSAVLTMPEQGIMVAILTNSRKTDPRELAVRAAAMALNEPFPQPELVALTSDMAEQWVGVYLDEHGVERTIGLFNDELYIRRGAGRMWPLQPSAAGYLHYDEGLSYLALTGDGTLELHQREGVMSRSQRKTAQVAPLNTVSLTSAQLKALTGVYQLAETFALRVFTEDNRLFIQGTGQNAGEVFALSATHLIAITDAVEFEFELDAAGAVTALRLLQGGQTFRAPKI